MLTLTAEQTFFIVKRLALLDAYPDIIADFAEEFSGLRLTAANIITCDPSRGAKNPVILQVYNECREAFLASEHACPTANSDVRLAELHRIAMIHKNANRLGEYRATLGQIALEVGAIQQRTASSGSGTGKSVTAITWTIVDPADPDAPQA